MFLSICLLVKMKMSNFSIFRFIVRVTQIERPRENEKSEIFPESEVFICKEKLDTQICLQHPLTCSKTVFSIR